MRRARHSGRASDASMVGVHPATFDLVRVVLEAEEVVGLHARRGVSRVASRAVRGTATPDMPGIQVGRSKVMIAVGPAQTPFE